MIQLGPYSYPAPDPVRVGQLGRKVGKRIYRFSWMIRYLALVIIFAPLLTLLFAPHWFERTVVSYAEAFGLSPDMGFAAFAVAFILLLLCLSLFQRSVNRRAVRGIQTPNLRIELKVDDTGVHFDAGTSAMQVRWHGIDEIIATPDGLLLVERGQFFFIPEMAWPDAEARQEFLAQARQHLSRDAQAKSSKVLTTHGT